MTEPVLLADTSAWHRASHPRVIDEWEEALLENRLATTAVVRLELLYSTRNAEEYRERSRDLDALIQIDAGSEVMARALAVQQLLAERAPLHQRSVKIADLVIAAAAELAGLTIWHYDSDYDYIAKVTGQRTQWIAERGSI